MISLTRTKSDLTLRRDGLMSNLPFGYPGRMRTRECTETALNSIRTTARLPETIGCVIRRGLRDWIERQQVECLHGPVSHRRNSKRPQFAVGLRNVGAP